MTRRAGFTLVELVAVLLIVGILAAVAAPKMFNAAASAADQGLKQSLATVRDAIEMYAASNAGAFPTCTGTGGDFRAALQGFLRGPFPKCPVGAKNSDVEPTTGTTTSANASPTCGWMFNTETGEFICNSTDTSPTDGVPYGDL